MIPEGSEWAIRFLIVVAFAALVIAAAGGAYVLWRILT